MIYHVTVITYNVFGLFSREKIRTNILKIFMERWGCTFVCFYMFICSYAICMKN